ncbi:MAG: phosphoribosyltransferase family protein [Minisyncoccia bacterium]
MDKFESVYEFFLDFLFPKSLSVEILENMSISSLLNSLPQARETKNERIIALFDYKNADVKTLVWELKYKGNKKIAGKLAEILFDVLEHELAERALFENFINPLLIPMPIADKRRRERGWNQTEILGEEIKKLNTNDLFVYTPNLLVKTHYTESQARTHATKRERDENLKNSMQAKNEVKNRCVIILDDVTTSGATFNEAKRALKQAGVKKILCVAIAH